MHGTSAKAIGPATGRNLSPSYSPDGQRIAFARSIPGVADSSGLWIMNADGSDAHAVIDGAAADVAWQPVPGTPEPPATTTTAPPNKRPVPVVTFSWMTTPRTLTTHGARSVDPDGTIASFQWNWGDGSAISTSKTASHTFTGAGMYLVRLRVTDNQGASSTSGVWVRVT